MDNSPQQRIYTEPVFLPDEVRARVESLLPHLSDFSLADANFLLAARGKIELGERLNRSELFLLNSIQQRPLAARTPLAAGGEVVL